MTQANSNYSNLIAAINANDWNEIFKLSDTPELRLLKMFSNHLQDKIDPEMFITNILEDHHPDLALLGKNLQNWLNANQNEIVNEYMSSLLHAFTHQGSQSQIDIQTSTLEKLTRQFPNRWETFINLAFCWIDFHGLSVDQLQQAKEINPSKEIIYLWSMILSSGNFDREQGYMNKGYELNKNCLFLYLFATKLEKNGRAEEAKKLYNKILDEEPEGSYLSNKAKKETKGFCFIATLVYPGKYDPEVNAFRALRDRYLVSRIGTTIVRFYYFISPMITELLRNSPTGMRITRSLLDGILRLCNRLGLVDIRYTRRE